MFYATYLLISIKSYDLNVASLSSLPTRKPELSLVFTRAVWDLLNVKGNFSKRNEVFFSSLQLFPTFTKEHTQKKIESSNSMRLKVIKVLSKVLSCLLKKAETPLNPLQWKTSERRTGSDSSIANYLRFSFNFSHASRTGLPKCMNEWKGQKKQKESFINSIDCDPRDAFEQLLRSRSSVGLWKSHSTLDL